MSKGFKPSSKNRPPVQTVEAEGGVIDETEEDYWKFALDDKEPFASMISVGTQVTGSVRGKSILIVNGANVLGFVPDMIAREIIKVAVKGRKLLGNVIAIIKGTDSSTELDVWVRLCLR